MTEIRINNVQYFLIGEYSIQPSFTKKIPANDGSNTVQAQPQAGKITGYLGINRGRMNIDIQPIIDLMNAEVKISNFKGIMTYVGSGEITNTIGEEALELELIGTLKQEKN